MQCPQIGFCLMICWSAWLSGGIWKNSKEIPQHGEKTFGSNSEIWNFVQYCIMSAIKKDWRPFMKHLMVWIYLQKHLNLLEFSWQLRKLCKSLSGNCFSFSCAKNNRKTNYVLELINIQGNNFTPGKLLWTVDNQLTCFFLQGVALKGFERYMSVLNK